MNLLFSKRKSRSRHTFRTMILSVAIAIGIWLMVVYINDPSIKINMNNIDVRFSGESDLRDRGFVVTDKDELQIMSATVSGKRSDLIDYMDNIYALVNVDDINAAGEYEMPVTIDMPTSKISLDRAKVNRIKIHIEPLAKKTIQIATKHVGINRSYFIKSVVEDNEVEISGAESEINKISYGAATIEVPSIQNVSEDNYTFSFYDNEGTPITSNSTIEANKAVVHIKNIPYLKASLKVVPELSEELKREYILDLSSTTVTPNSIEAGISNDFHGTTVSAIVDRIDANVSDYYVAYSDGLYVPENNKKIQIKPTLLHKKTGEMRLNVTAKNVPENVIADYAQTISVTLDCAENVTADDITAEIDLEGLSKGAYKIPVNITGKNIENVPYTEIDVTIK